LVEGKRVRLEYDQQRQDRCGRTLAYVYLEDETFVNAEIVRQGDGFAYTRFPFTYLEEFRRLGREAREAKRGLWNDAGTTLAQGLGGAALLIGLFFVWRSIWATERNLRSTQDTTVKNLAIAMDGQITERFTRAIDQLCSDKLQIRLERSMPLSASLGPLKRTTGRSWKF
jgi:hypothetical protein